MSWRFAALFGIGLLLLPSAGRAASRIACQKPVLTGANFSMTCTYAHQSMPLTLVMRGAVEDAQHDKDTATAKPAKIAIFAAGKLRQTLSVDSDGVWLNSLQKEALESIDLNFDGYDDLKVWTQTSAGPNSGYAYWLYDPSKRAFERRQDLDDRLSGFDVSVDPKTKTVSLSGRDNCCAWTIDTYRWANGKLAQISGEESGEFDLGDALSDIASIQAFGKTSPQFCATRTSSYDAAGRITKDVIETQGDPCDDPNDYRKAKKGIDKSLNGAKRHGNITDVYRDGILFQRTIVYDPPRSP
jgi:hypothetical protein